MDTRLQKNIMRRIYYAFAIRMATHTYTLHALLAAVALYFFARFVFVAAVIDNLLAIRVGEVPSYILNAFLHTDVLTLLTTLVLMGVTASLSVRLLTQHHPRTLHTA